MLVVLLDAAVASDAPVDAYRSLTACVAIALEHPSVSSHASSGQLCTSQAGQLTTPTTVTYC